MAVLTRDVVVVVHAQHQAAKQAANPGAPEVYWTAADIAATEREEDSSLPETAAGTATGQRSSRAESTGPWLLMISTKGFGKRVPLSEVPIKLGRGLQGSIGMKLHAGDKLAMALLVHSKDDDIVMASRQGMMARCRAADVRILGRAAKGVKMLALNEGDEVQTVAVVPFEHKTALA
jgi:DNA gyrase subunit A